MKYSEKYLDEKMNTILNRYANDAVSWAQADDGIRDLAHDVRVSYNELVLDVIEGEAGYVEALNFRSFHTPADWNTNAKNQIIDLWKKMTPWAKLNAMNTIL